MNIVIDTNVLVSGIFWHGVPGQILDKWVNNKFELITSTMIIEEYADTLLEISKGKRGDLVQNWLLLITQYAHTVEIKKRFHLSADPDDDKFIECAVAGDAQYIISGDKHLLDLKAVFNIDIVTPRAFINLLT